MKHVQPFVSFCLAAILLLTTTLPVRSQQTNYTYDDRGNLISNGTHCIEYNGRNLPAVIKDCATDLPIENYEYRPDGQRFRVERYHEGVHVETILNIDDFVEIKINETTGEEQTSYYIHANGVLVGKILPDGSKHFYHTDHLGSIILITDEAGNPVADRSIYGPFGNLVTANQSTSAFGYTGQETDSTGLSWYNSRAYDPRVGVFLQPDAIRPSVEPADLNPYAYVKNNPLKYTDPSGNIVCGGLCIGGVVLGIAVVALVLAEPVGQNVDQKSAAYQFNEAIENFGPTVAGSAPLTGDFIDGVDTATGVDSFTGEQLSTFDRGITAVAAVVPFISGRHIRSSVEYGSNLWSSTRRLSRVENAFEHWRRHRDEFPHLNNALEYVDEAHRIINKPPSSALVGSRANGEIVVYDPIRNVFAVGLEDGTPKTMFVPDPARHGYRTNQDYFYANINEER